MRIPTVAAALVLSACAAGDDTPLWSPYSAAKTSYARSATKGRIVVPPKAPQPRTTRDKALPGNRYDGPQDAPTAVSGGPLSRDERRGLSAARQSIDRSIERLERRARFRGETAAEARQLRVLKARQKDVIRRLRSR